MQNFKVSGFEEQVTHVKNATKNFFVSQSKTICDS